MNLCRSKAPFEGERSTVRSSTGIVAKHGLGRLDKDLTQGCARDVAEHAAEHLDAALVQGAVLEDNLGCGGE